MMRRYGCLRFLPGRITLDGHSFRNNGVAFSHDGNRLVAGGPNGTVLIYDATRLPEKP